MKIFLCIDDTDNLDSPGTGHLLNSLKNEIEEMGMGNCSRITRHQLFVHEDVPYTSHNSAMCCSIDMNNDKVNPIIEHSINFLLKTSAEGSDPGLCVLDINSNFNKEKLIDFGNRAKKEVLTKKEAYNLAKELNLHLSEHGGTGDGIIGALAGVGLRLGGNDGRYKGWFTYNEKNSLITVEEICTFPEVDEVFTFEKEKLDNNETVLLREKLKTVHFNSNSVLLVEKPDKRDKDILWQSCSKERIKAFT
jgi:hypothetical protein